MNRMKFESKKYGCTTVTVTQARAAITISGREFNQDVSKAKKEANRGPVFITDRGQPSHVLLSIDDYQQLTGGKAPLATLLAMADGDDIIFSAPKMNIATRAAEFDD